MLYAYLETPIGTISISEENGFISSVLFVNQKTQPQNQSNLLTEAKNQLTAYFNGELTIFNLPLKQAGTLFQQNVWQNLQNVAYAKTSSYSALANKMQNILAIRAIAAANGKNKIMIIVPCHRVIGKNGEMTGYAGEIWRKLWLLNHEIKIAGLGQATLEL
ncbi:MAG: methylated-DNA--[protein]-cysteine S-methyltransferase [Sphingobacteriales bacterium]|nr:MAG: methylated-DNA--[protein]-cysteine S-methyltransferase [Sphingobacteriales bacterium]